MNEPGAQLPTSMVGTVLGRYRLERLLGEGGMGVVYAARHQDLGKVAAVKLLHERYDASEQVRVRFLREGQAVSRIRHPNIVDIYDVGTESGRVFLVMELLEGEDLRSLIAREGPLSPQRTADLLVPVVSALAAAHELGVVHRDLKPDNIFLATERNTLHPKVLDFGISKVSDPEKAASLTGTGTLLGTPYYMSPEQAQTEKNIDSRSDQYSLGVILYECVTGRRPIEDPALYQLIQRIVHGDYPRPRQVNPNIPAAFEQLIQRAMAREAAARFPTTRALGRALLGFASERVSANYSEEFASDGPPHTSPSAPPAPNGTSGLGTTLRESVHERDSTKRPAPGRPRNPWLIAGALAFAGVVAAFAWKTARPTAEPAAAVSLGSPGVQVEPPKTAAAVRSATPAPVPSAGAGSAAAAPPPSASAAATASGSVAEPSRQNPAGTSAKTPKRRAPPASDRPELAPR